MSQVIKIIVKVANTELSLTPEEVRELRDTLNEIYPPIKENVLAELKTTNDMWKYPYGTGIYVQPNTIRWDITTTQAR